MSNMSVGGYLYGSYPTYASSTPGTAQYGMVGIHPDGESRPGMPGNPDSAKTNGMEEECQTCKNRKYQDGSDESNVSFQTATHISPTAAGSAVRAHEQQHVSNAYKKAEMDNGKVLRASVTIHTSICPECGRSYVSGGTTSTQIKYYNEENPYQKDLKSTDGVKYKGMNVDLTA